MQATSFQNALRALQRRAPFQKFTVALINGDRVQVQHPEALVVRNGVAVHFAPDGEMTIFDHEGVNEIIHNAKPKRGNGHA